MKLRYISLFAGIEAWSCAVAGMPEYEAVAFSEIDPFACAVLAYHYPNVPNLGDVRNIDGTQYRGRVDLIVGGSPCQNFSVAGNRKGLQGVESVLALEYIRLLNEIQPSFFLWENVPGCMSTNSGNDLRMLLEAFQDSGFILDVDVLDSQFFGVPQRRRRIFVCGTRIGYLLSRKTTSSALIISKCLLALLQRILTVLSSQLEIGRSSLASPDILSAGLRKKINFLFRHGKPEEEWTSLLSVLDAELARCVPALKSSVATLGDKSHQEQAADLLTVLSTESRSGLIAELSKTNWEGLSLLRKLFTTSTETRTTTKEAIFVCSKTALHISWLITLIRLCYPNLSIVDISDLTPMQEFTKYARWTSSSLFGDIGRAGFWADFIRQARQQEEAFRRADKQRHAEILPLTKSLQRNPPPRRKAGQGDSRGAEAGAGNGRLAGTLCASGAGLDRPSASGNQLDYCVVDRESYGIPGNVIRPSDTTGGNGKGYDRECSPTLTVQDRHAVAYAVRTAQTGANGIGIDEETAHTLDSAGVQAVAVERERERDGSLRNGGCPPFAGRQGDVEHDRREAHRSTASGKQTFPTLCANCGSKLWLGNQEAFSGDYFIKEPR